MTGRTARILSGIAFVSMFLPGPTGAFDVIHCRPASWGAIPVISVTPPDRGDYGTIYDAPRRRMVVFGGSSDGTIFGDMWALTLTGTPAWTEITPGGASPGPRTGHSMIYDPIGQKIWMFGGSNGAANRNDLWTLNLTGAPAWTQVSTSSSPPVRRGHTAVYDSAGRRMIVFGGTPTRNDVWSINLDGLPSWTQLLPGGGPPAGRQTHTAVYDPTSNRMIVFGGEGAGASLLGDVWSLGLTGAPAWTNVTPPAALASPGLRKWCAGTWDPATQSMLVFGGEGATGTLEDVWSLALPPGPPPSWSDVTPTDGPSPGPRSRLAAITDADQPRQILFGGRDGEGGFHSDLWAFGIGAVCDTADTCDGEGWVQVSSVGPAPRTFSAMAADDARAMTVLFGGLVNGLHVADTWEWDGTSWYAMSPVTIPPGRSSHAMAYDKQRRRVVMFGGETNGLRFGDTWEWDGANWTQKFSPSFPSPRYGHTMAYDESLKKVVLHAGYDGALRNDTWTWNGTTWTPLLPPTSPPVRMYGAMATDPQRRRIVLFGGRSSPSPASALDDTWEFDGATWTPMATVVKPTARSTHGMAWGPGCNRIVVYGGIGVAPLNTTWRWGGYAWHEEAFTVGDRIAPAMATDVPNARAMLFSGGDPITATPSRITSELCCECDDEVALLDSLGNVVFPPTTDFSDPPVYTDVDSLLGDVDDLYPDEHTSTDTWYPDFPCDEAIGGTVPDGATNPAVDDSLNALGVNATEQEIADSLAVWEQEIEQMIQNDPDRLATAGPVGPATPYIDPAEPYCPPRECKYVFGGRDIVFIHGLKLKHVFDRMLGTDPRANTNWVQPTVFPGRTQNPEFYNSGGYYRDIAYSNWIPHFQKFLSQRGYCNRFVVVSYNCGERLDVAARSVLTQISDAMRYGTNVEDLTGRGYKGKFGTPSFVIVSHSTGGLVADAALWAAQSYPNLQAQFIARRCKAHFALTSAFGGSRLASAGIVLAGILGNVPPPWLCPLMRAGMQLLDDTGTTLNPPNCPFGWGPALTSILVDLSPVVTKYKWGTAIDNTNVPTVTLTGAHPTHLVPVGTVLNAGMDDAVLTLNSTSANPNAPFLWPSGFIAKFPGGLVKTFDMGMFQTYPARAIGYYVQQVHEPRRNPLTSLPNYIAAGAIPYLSPTGMLQSVGLEFPLNGGYSPLARHNRHLSFVSSASDHFVWRAVDHGDDYHPTYGSARNYEETRTMLQSDEPQWYANYTPGPTFYPQDDQPLMTASCLPNVVETIKGRKIEFKIKLFKKKIKKTWWIWKRRYHNLDNMGSKMAADYMYDSILNTACSGLIRDCDPTPVGVEVETPVRRFAASSHPNPFQGTMTLAFDLPADGVTQLTIHDVSGRTVRTLVEGTMKAGAHRVEWTGNDDRGNDVAPGIYFWKLRLGEREIARKVLMVR